MITIKKSRQDIPFLKSKILPVLFGMVLLFLIALSYFNNRIFLDKIVLCGLIIGMLFFIKIAGNNYEVNPNNKNGSNLN